MKVTSKVLANGPIPGKTNVIVNISVEFSGPAEALNISVIVPNEGTETEQEKHGMERAKTLAYQFASLPRT